MLPKMDRPEPTSAARGGDGPPGRRPVQPAQPVQPPAQEKKQRRRWPIGKILLLLLVAWLVFLIAVPLWAWSKIEKVDADPAGTRPASQPGATYLLVGSDSRKGLSKKEKRRLGAGGVGDVGQRTDTIMLLHTGSGPSMLLSIPRDSLVDIPGHGTTKINAAFAYGGPKLLVKTIEQNTGIRVDHYVEIGFGGFVNSVDAVGGITICPTQRMKDRRANLNIKKGCQEVDGVTALGYSRSRHVSKYGDLDRARHQREVVSAIGSEVKSPWTFINPVRYFRVNDAATSSLVISKGTGPIALARFGLAMTRVNGKNGLTCAMPIADQAIHWDKQRALALIKYIKTDSTGDIPKRLCTPTGLPGVNN
jgi:LCP family protein required for cell wall assembly